jgi:hypothetical protein
MTHDELAQVLLDAVRAQRFELTPDAMAGGARVRQMPSVDLALIAFPRNAPPVWANVLFSREHPQGVVADIGGDAGPVRNIRFDADLRNAESHSVAWWPESDWQRLHFEPLWGDGPHRFVAPYPASLAKLMVAVGVAQLVDQQHCGWTDALTYRGRSRSVAAWCEDMIAVSSNGATRAMVALLHHCGALSATYNALHEDFALSGLPTLSLARTRADGGWDNAAGAGVGQLQMTAWDSARLLWLLDADAPTPAPWLAPGTPPLLSRSSMGQLRGWLEDQALHVVLSSTALAGEPGWVAGLPAQLPPRWIGAGGGVHAGKYRFLPDVRVASRAATLRFAHKSGGTENYASDAGIVRGIAPHRHCHYIIAVLSSLGARHAPGGACATTWRLPALGRTLDAAIAPWLEHA